MNLRELIIEYIYAVEENDTRNNKIEEGISLLCNGEPVDIDSMTYRLYSVYDQFVIRAAGQEAFEWINWYLYESTFTGRSVRIDGDELGSVVDIEIASPEMLYDVCIAKLIETDECQSSIQAACGGLTQTPMEF